MEVISQTTIVDQMGGSRICRISECGSDGKLNEFKFRKKKNPSSLTTLQTMVDNDPEMFLKHKMLWVARDLSKSFCLHAS